MSGALVSAITIVASALTATLMVPAIRKVALHRNLLDYPDGDRHHHATPVPRLGGVAVFAGILVAVGLSALLSPGPVGTTLGGLSLNGALVLASAILFVIGLLDDLRGVSPALKLIGQTGAASIVISAGFTIDKVSLVPGYEFSLGVMAIPITAIWLVGVSNAFNLIDGLDGLAGGVGVIALVAISASAATLGNEYVPTLSIALAGALLGFLWYNRPPARIFLGDSGSLVVGFLLAFLAVRGSTTASGEVYALVPIFALSYLLLDTGIAILRRWLRGSPLSRADGRHIHHQLLAMGLTPRRAVAVIYVKSAFIALLGLCVTFVPPRMTLAISALGAALLLAIFMYGIRWLEYHEFLEAGASFASGVRKVRTAIQDRIVARDVARLIWDATSFESVNAIVKGHSGAFRFAHMEVLSQDSVDAARTMNTPESNGVVTWLLAYPVATNGAGDGRLRVARALSTPVLAIWCSVSPEGRPPHPERVAQILAPSIAHALDRSLGLVTGETARPRWKRASGAHAMPTRRVSAEHRRVSSDASPNM